MSELTVSALVRNEAGKYWRSCLSAWSEFADKIVVLDDASEDDTQAIAREFPKVVLEGREQTDPAAWGKENWARQAQWALTMEHSEEGDAILILDADMVPASDPRDLIQPDIDIYYFALYDLWTSEEIPRYREDSFWCAHFNPRVWMIRRPADSFQPIWSERGIHSGHLPLNLPASRQLYAPRDYALLHYAYLDKRDRSTKAKQYASVETILSPTEVAHATSILDSNPNLKPLPMEPKWPLKRAT